LVLTGHTCTCPHACASFAAACARVGAWTISLAIIGS
jgi:hypothetical protein